MAITITRTPWIDDDGSGTTGTVINNAEKTALYNQIDQALAQLLPLAGAATITGPLTVNAIGGHGFIAAGTGQNNLTIRNTVAGATNSAALWVGNDADQSLLTLTSYSSTYTPNNFAQPNGSLLFQNGAGGLSIMTLGAAAAMRFYTGSGAAERMRIPATGEVLINATTNPNGGQLFVVTDGSARPNAIVLYNGATTLLNFLAFINSAGAVAGLITQTSQTTVAYNTSSDRRLKIDRGRATNLDALRGVVVHDFDWKADGRADRGVFAQEAAAVFPRAITEGADDLTEGGDLARPWMTDYSKFVPDLIAGWQRHDATIALLRAELAALKGSPNA
jgi:hypothetical protein